LPMLHPGAGRGPVTLLLICLFKKNPPDGGFFVASRSTHRPAASSFGFALGFGAQARAWMPEVEQRMEQLPDARSMGSPRTRRGCAGDCMDAEGRATQEQLPKLSEGWPTRCGPVRCQSRDGLSANPGAASRTRSTGTVRRARVSGALSFGYFSLRRAPALRPSGQLRCSRRSCGAVSTQRKVTRSPGGE
jgi:hypothetical protein